jgi:dCMP deaminase
VITERLEVDEYFIEIARLVAQRGTCARRQVGCVLVNEQNHILATGYNGVAKGVRHCIDTPCPGSRFPSGQGLHQCEAIHAEQNALMQCRNINEVHTVYTTSSPCIGCTRLLLNTGCKRVVFLEPYPHPEAQRLWEGLGRQWVHYMPPSLKKQLPVRLTKLSPPADDLVQLEFRLPPQMIQQLNSIGIPKVIDELKQHTIEIIKTFY